VVENPEGVCGGVVRLVLDGVIVPGQHIALHDDAATHRVQLTLGRSELAEVDRLL